MKYKPESEYQVEIALVDNTKDTFNLKGADLVKLREKIYLHGYTRVDKDNKAVTRWVSPFVIAGVTVTEKPQIK